MLNDKSALCHFQRSNNILKQNLFLQYCYSCHLWLKGIRNNFFLFVINSFRNKFIPFECRNLPQLGLLSYLCSFHCCGKADSSKRNARHWLIFFLQLEKYMTWNTLFGFTCQSLSLRKLITKVFAMNRVQEIADIS